MKTFFRILGYAKPWHKHFPQYTLFSLLSILFNLANLALLQPLFAVIFDTMDAATLAEKTRELPFALELEYFESLFYRKLQDVATTYGKGSTLIFVSVVIGVSALMSNLFTYISNVIMSVVRANVIRRVRDNVFHNTTSLHLGFFSGERKGDIMSRMTNDIQEIEVTVVNAIKVIFIEPTTIIVYLAFLFSKSLELTLFTLIFFPVVAGIISEIVKRLKKKAVLSQESLSRIVSTMDETFSGMRVIKAFNAKKYVNNLFSDETATYRKVIVSMARKNELASPVSQFLGIIVVSTLLAYGGSLVLDEATTAPLGAEELLVYIIVFSQILNPAKSISQYLSGIQRGMASARRVFRLIDETPQIRNQAKPIVKADFTDAITFKNVGFSYEKQPVLKEIELVIEKGKTIALVGSSGAGKSTLADLIPRFFDATEGQILIDGVALQEVEIDSLRSLMGIVTQESILFNDTVAKNIAFAMPHANREEVMAAAKIANAHDFIMNLEQGYDTNIGERGSKLSGGQRQRLSIARAVMKNPPILILDEATSALDSESEKLVQEAITNLMKNRTSIVIAHRLSTIQHADEILVMQEGKIIERGNHDELMSLRGTYTKLIAMQSI